MVKPFDLVRMAKDRLTNSDTPQLDAEVILSHAMGRDRMYLFLNRDMNVHKSCEELFWKLVDRRSRGEPVAYITGKREFMGMEFLVEPGVLIPRADTEILVEQVIAQTTSAVFDRAAEKEDFKERLVIIDLGCGSGAISVSLAKFIEDAMVYAIDIMDQPIRMTNKNVEWNQVQTKVTVISSDLFEKLDRKLAGNVDVIVSNPPYIDLEEYGNLMTDVREYEPQSALTDNGDGLEFYRRISLEAPMWLKKTGLLAFEIGCSQAKQVMGLMKKNGFVDLKCIKDLSGKDRVVIGRMI